jgi:hypothetical protein
MRKKTIAKTEVKLSFLTRLLLAFGLPPKKLYEARHVFTTAEHSLDSGLRVWIRRKCLGQIRMYSPIWIKTYKQWVQICVQRSREFEDGKDRISAQKELKGAFFSAIGHHFGPFTGPEAKGDNPLVEAVVAGLIEIGKKQLTDDGWELLRWIGNGSYTNCPESQFQMRALAFMRDN